MVTAALAAACFSARAVEPVRLHAYPQKFATFHQENDRAVPEALKRAADPLPAGDVHCVAIATDGAVWLGTRTGAIRIDHAADPPDRRQYLAGRRYLPDDNVLNLTPDSSGGV